ncbi:MAG: hypothetical protein VZR02_01200 [Lachnospiraceae bacterium]|nr:hypothetical protein [Lachnospiraceae bacterium]
MKPVYIKYSDERNKRSSICTRILEDDQGFRVVTKEAIWPEGQAHINELLHFYDVIRASYDGILPCPVAMKGDKAEFPYLNGISLEAKYKDAYDRRDRKRFLELMKRHVDLAVGGNKTLCDFPILPASGEEEQNDTEKFWTVFGDPAPYAGQKALGAFNFDAIAGNIVYYREDAYFIDYEWVLEFPVPVDLVIYHSVGDLWLHLEGLEDFLPKKEAMEFLGVKTPADVLEKSYLNWWYSIIRDDGKLGFADRKHISVKGHSTMEDLIREKDEAVRSMDFAARYWKQNQEEVQRLAEELKETQTHWSEEYSKMTADRDAWMGHYYDVANSKTWRTVQKAKKIIKR